jgi:hypothetical protein
MGVSRASLYYVSKQMPKDWAVKIRMEEELRRNPSYGSRRLAQALGVNRKRTQRVMHMFGVKPYRRRESAMRIDEADAMIKKTARENEACQRLVAIPGGGPYIRVCRQSRSWPVRQRGVTAWSVADGVRSVPPTLRIVVEWRLLRYDRSLRKAGCRTQL